MQRRPWKKTGSASGIKATFVTFSHPSQFKSKKTRRTVRSYVTTRQHQEARSKVALHMQVSQDVETGLLDTASEGNGGQTSASPKARLRCPMMYELGCESVEGKSAGVGLGCAGDSLRTRKADVIVFGDAWGLVAGSGSANVTGATGLPLEQPEGSPSAHGLKESETTIRNSDSLRKVEYFSTILFPLSFTALNLSEAETLTAMEFLHRLSRDEPALRHSRLLFASGHLAQIGIVSKDLCVLLNQKAIASTFEALADERRTDSEGIILATGYLALYECIFGDRQAAHLHRVAQSRMINMRGGIEALALPSGIKYAIAWADMIMSMHESKAFLTEESFVGNCCNVPRSLKALGMWSPKQYAALMLELSNPSNRES